MADVMKLTYSATNVEFSPRPGYRVPQRRKRTVIEALDGTPYIYEWGSKGRWEIPLDNISITDKSNLTSWWESMNTLTFTPNVPGAPSTTNSVFIVNEEAPFSLMFVGEYETSGAKYEGTLILQEV